MTEKDRHPEKERQYKEILDFQIFKVLKYICSRQKRKPGSQGLRFSLPKSVLKEASKAEASTGRKEGLKCFK